MSLDIYIICPMTPPCPEHDSLSDCYFIKGFQENQSGWPSLALLLGQPAAPAPAGTGCDTKPKKIIIHEW